MIRYISLLVVALLSAAVGMPRAEAAGTADLKLSVTAVQTSVVADQSVTFSIDVTNAGPDAAKHVHLFDRVPPDVIVGVPSAGGTYDPARNRIEWKEGTLEPFGAITESATFTAIHPTDPLTDVARVRTASADPTAADTASADTTVEAEPGVEYVSVRDTGLAPSFHNIPLGGTIQWDGFGPSVHEITDSHGLGFIDTGPMTPISYARFTFDVSGEIRTQDLPAFPTNAGKLVVPVQVAPSSGGTATTYTVRWALSAPPPGLVEDVQIKRPDGRWTGWRHDAGLLLEDSFVPDVGAGVYAFRSRLRNAVTGSHSRFGPPVTIDVG